MSASPSFTVLLDWIEGRLDATAAREVDELVRTGDRETTETVAWIRRFLHDAGLMRLQAPPPELSARLRAIFPGAVAPRGAGGWTDADLLYDTRRPGAAAGSRGAAVAESAHLAFDCGDLRIVLQITPAGVGKVDVHGLVAPVAEDLYADVSFLVLGQLVRAVHVGAEGSFDLLGLPEDADEMWVMRNGARVRAALDLRLP